MKPRIILALVPALALGGCLGLGGAKAPPFLLTLSATESKTASAAQPAMWASGPPIVIEEPLTDSTLAVPRVPVQIDATRVAYVPGAVWADRPARLFRDLLAELIRRRGGHVVLTDAAVAPPGAVRVGGTLSAFGYDAASRMAVVRLDLLVARRGGGPQQLALAASQPALPTAESLGPALNAAANQVADQVAAAIEPMTRP